MKPRVTATMRAAVLDLWDGKSISSYSFETWSYLIAEDLVSGPHGDAELTPKGTELGAGENRKRQETRDKRKKSARARTGAMQSLGLVRTRGGQWE